MAGEIIEPPATRCWVSLHSDLSRAECRTCAATSVQLIIGVKMHFGVCSLVFALSIQPLQRIATQLQRFAGRAAAAGAGARRPGRRGPGGGAAARGAAPGRPYSM